MILDKTLFCLLIKSLNQVKYMMLDIYNVSIVNCVLLIFLCICTFVNGYGSEIYLKVKKVKVTRTNLGYKNVSVTFLGKWDNCHQGKCYMGKYLRYQVLFQERL